MAYKYGALPAVRPAALSDLAVYAKGKLPTPPKKVVPPPAPYPIDGNAEYGDCTYAGVAHCLEAWNVEVKVRDHIPDEQETVSAYFAETGGEDTGCVESNVLHRWYTRGLFGAKIAGYAPVPIKDLLQQHQAIAFYGACYYGIECPASAQEQFAEGVPWTYEGEEPEGGHCIVGLGYNPNGSITCATWGGLAEVTPGFLAHYGTEAWCILSHQFVEHKGDALGIDLKTLQANLVHV